MGNDQSNGDLMKARRSIDSSLIRQVHSAQSTPRLSVSSGCHSRMLKHKTSESDLPSFSPNLARTRFSTDCSAELRCFRGKNSVCEMGNQPGRRLSRAAVQADVDGGALQDTLKLTAYQVQLLQSTWSRIKMSHNNFSQIFKLLCFKSPQSREMFQKMSIVQGFKSNQCTDLNSHAKILSDLLDSLMSDLQQQAKMVQARCMDIGGAHVNMSEKCCGSLFDVLGECLTEVITKVDCVRSKREAVKAWITLLSFLVDAMKCGYMDEWKRKQQNARLNGIGEAQ